MKFLTLSSSREASKILVWLRVALGIFMMLESFQVWSSIDSIYGPYGFLEAGLMDVISGISVPSFAHVLEAHGLSYLFVLHCLYWVRWAFLLTFTFGIWTYPSTIAVWIFQVLIMASGSVSNYGVDRYFHLFLFILVLAPLLKPRRTLFALQVALLITYTNAGVSKALGFEWWNGEAVWRVFNLPEFQRVSFLWFARVPWLPMMLGWTTLFFETFYIFGILIPRARLLWILMIVGMHISIALFMGLVDFGIAMSAFNLILFWPILQTDLRKWSTRFPQLARSLA